ncbi:hypothetical protein [Paenibacillus aestuarii]|uniref:Uncharacterized protein n=1 Tax=Paenibacillus aestuarii TaxID=516965 RepID=A0ABW0KD36_9BACL|nr:hypothetical protein [Paenibacillus aestuarii]
MGTRLLTEHFIKRHFPKLRYVRVHTHGNHAATIYAWNEDLKLQENEMRHLKQFAGEYLYPYVCFQVKAYNLVLTDLVPQIAERELPEALLKAALSRSLSQHRIMAVMDQLFPRGKLSFIRYDSPSGTLHFEFESPSTIDASERDLLHKYLTEMIPVGSLCEVTYL